MDKEQTQPAGFLDLARLTERMDDKDRDYILCMRDLSLCLAASHRDLTAAIEVREALSSRAHLEPAREEAEWDLADYDEMLIREALNMRAAGLYLRAVDALVVNDGSSRYRDQLKRPRRDCDRMLREIVAADGALGVSPGLYGPYVPAGELVLFKGPQKVWALARPEYSSRWVKVERLLDVLLKPALEWVKNDLDACRNSIFGQLGAAIAGGLEITPEDFTSVISTRNGKNRKHDQLETEYEVAQPNDPMHEQSLANHLRNSEEKRLRKVRKLARAA